MTLTWVLFVASVIVTYIGISIFGQLTGGSSTSAWHAFISSLKPIPFLVLVVANMFFAVALYFGFALTRYALPMTIASGAIVSFIYSVFVLGSSVTAIKIFGIILAVAGIALLGM